MAEQEASLRRIESRFEGAGGRSLFRRGWLPESPRRVLVVVHGFGEHSGRYEEFGRHFAHLGYAVHAYDHVGHGQSVGARGHADAFEDLHDDLASFLSLVRSEHPGLPLVLLGHSMGGLVVSSFVVERNPDIDLLVTSGAMLALSADVSSVKLMLARWLRRIWPTLSLEAGLDVDGLSRDPDVVRRYVEDPLVHGKASAAFAAGMTDAIERTQGRAQRVQVPMLILHGAEDPLCDPDGSRNFFEGLSPGTVAASEIHVYPNLRHEIFNEPEHQQVWADLAAWIDRRASTNSEGSP